jgi:hypothetical protein
VSLGATLASNFSALTSAAQRLAAGLAEEVADHIARGASGRSDLEATITVSDEG